MMYDDPDDDYDITLYFEEMEQKAAPYLEMWRTFILETREEIWQANLAHENIDMGRLHKPLVVDLYPYDPTRFIDNLGRTIIAGLSQPLRERRAFFEKLLKWVNDTYNMLDMTVKNTDIWRASVFLHFRQQPTNVLPEILPKRLYRRHAQADWSSIKLRLHYAALFLALRPEDADEVSGLTDQIKRLFSLCVVLRGRTKPIS